MKQVIGIVLLCLSFQINAQDELIGILDHYFGKTRSSGSQLETAQRSFFIRHDSLFICFRDPTDLFTKGEYRDTNAIPLHALQELKISQGKSAQGSMGIGLQFIPRFVEPGIQLEAKNSNGATVTVKSDRLNQVAAGTLNQKLTGQVAGVTVSNDNSPGGAAMVRIRGFGSINANSPLFVVDDVPVTNINTINPSDIESVTVLKDPSTTAIYGVRGANGVVVIKTKKGGVSSFVVPDEIKNQKPLNFTLWTYGSLAREFKKKNAIEVLRRLLLR
jgi:TonB-dependent SusC/RagA subfamily outer membrane receptor